MNVLLFPPNDYDRIWVSSELRYGTNAAAFFRQLLASVYITIPRLVKLLFILLAYCNLTPVAPVLDCLSEPAKSTMLNLD